MRRRFICKQKNIYWNGFVWHNLGDQRLLVPFFEGNILYSYQISENLVLTNIGELGKVRISENLVRRENDEPRRNIKSSSKQR